MTVPFLIYALPRSRTKWLSAFLSYREWVCHHERAMHMRSMQDVCEFFNTPNTGTAETAAGPGHLLIKHFVPNIKEVVVLRPVDEVVERVMKIDIAGVGVYSRENLRKGMEYCDRVLQKIIRNPNVLTVNFSDLVKQDTCAAIFEHCLPYRFDKKWWQYFKDFNIQISTKELLKYRFNHRVEIDAFKNHCKSELRRLYKLGVIMPEGVI